MVGCGARLVATFRFAVQSTPCPRGKVKPILGAAVDSPGARYRKLPDRYRLNHYIEERALLRRQRCRNCETISYRGTERFGFASTLKVFAVAEFLRRTSADGRDELVRWTEFDIDRAGYSPVTTEALDTGLTAAELAEAAV